MWWLLCCRTVGQNSKKSLLTNAKWEWMQYEDGRILYGSSLYIRLYYTDKTCFDDKFMLRIRRLRARALSLHHKDSRIGTSFMAVRSNKHSWPCLQGVNWCGSLSSLLHSLKKNNNNNLSITVSPTSSTALQASRATLWVGHMSQKRILSLHLQDKWLQRWNPSLYENRGDGWAKRAK